MTSPQTEPTNTRSVPVSAASGSHSVSNAAWGLPAHRLSRWPPTAAICVAIALYLLLPEKLLVFSWMRPALPILEALLIIPIVFTSVRDRFTHHAWKRPAFMVLIACLTFAYYLSVGRLVQILLHAPGSEARTILFAAIEVWITNVIIFGLWYWELDRGGPVERLLPNHPEPDFLFPQMVTPLAAESDWTPSFMDYVYVSFTNATAFSPTDTMPLTHWAKLLMMVQALGSLLVIGLVAARAVNIL